jgi:hypothetical protein
MSFSPTAVKISAFYDYHTGAENPQHYKVSGGYCETEAERDALLASFPKSLGLKPVALHSYADGGNVVTYGIQGHGKFLATKGNEKNETGIKRALRLLEVLEFDADVRSSNAYRSADELRAAL